MAALTWRDVAAPNFSGANEGFRTASALIGNAIQTAQNTLANYDKQQTAQESGQILSNALRISDPAKYQQALADGSIFGNIDPSKIDPSVLSALGARGGALAKEAAYQRQADASAYSLGRAKQENQIGDAARASSAQQLGITDPNLAALPVPAQQSFATSQQNLAGSALDNAQKLFRNVTGSRDDAARQAALAATTDAMQSSLTVDDARAKLESANLTPAARALATAAVGQQFPGLYGPLGSGGSGGGGAPGTRGGSSYDATFNFTPTATPVSSMPISDVLSVQDKLKQSQGNSPVGAFQINQATLQDYAPKVLGANWKNQTLSPDNQEKIAKQIFDDRKGGDLTKTWSSLPNSNPGAYKNYTWQDMRQVLANGEVGQNLPEDPSVLNSMAKAALQQIQGRVAQNQSVGLTPDVQNLFSDVSTPGEAANKLIKVGGFTGADPAAIIDQITTLKNDNPGISDAQAAAAIARNASSTKWWKVLDGKPNLGAGLAFNEAGAQRDLNDLKRGTTARMSLDTQNTQGAGSALTSAQQNFNQAMSDYQAAISRQRTQPKVDISGQADALIRAKDSLQRAIQNQQAEPRLQPVYR